MKLSGFIVRHNKGVQKLFILIVFVNLLLFPFVGINYDLTKYLPNSAPSKAAINKMEESFGYPGTGRVMLNDVTLYEAKVLKNRMEKVDGVDMVLWCDTTTDVYEGSDFIDFSKLDDYYKDNKAIMDITFKQGDTSKTTQKAIRELQKITGDKGYFVGLAPQSLATEESVNTQMNMILVIAFIFIFLILLLTTSSWFEPVLFLTAIGSAIFLNGGSNILLGKISFLSNNVMAVLQLAVSMDYAIFMLHAFMREQKTTSNREEALTKALDLSIKTILASSLTTFVGFIVLVLMKFKIGEDMGFVLSKGILCSLFTVIFLMPSLILNWSPQVEKFHHRSFLPSFKRTARVFVKISPVMIILSLIIALPAYVAQNKNTFLFGNDAVGAGKGTKIYDQQQEIDQTFGKSNLLVAIFPHTDDVKEKKLSDELKAREDIKKVQSIAAYLPDGVPESILPKSTTELFHKNGYTRFLIYTRTNSESEAAFQSTNAVTEIIKKYYPEDSYVTGNTPSTMDMRDMLTKDYALVNNLAMVGIFLVVAFSFKTPILAIVALIPIEIAVFVNMAFPYIAGDSLLFMGYLIVSCIQQGATVDYAILTIDNYLGFRKEMGKNEAAIATIEHSLPSIVTSGSILLVCGYAVYFISSVPAIAEMGHLIGRGAICSMVFVTTLLPGLLKLMDRFVVKSDKPKEKKIKSFSLPKKPIKLGKRVLH